MMPRVIEVNSYYPLGIQINSLSHNSEQYRYGFNGLEMDNEIKGIGNSYTTEFRLYDPRVPRWLSVDPLAEKYTGISPYVYVANSPTIFIDSDGRELRFWTTYRNKKGELMMRKVTYSDLDKKSQQVVDIMMNTEDIIFLSSFISENNHLDIVFDEGKRIFYTSGRVSKITGTVSSEIFDDGFTMKITVDKTQNIEKMAIDFGHELFLHAEGNLVILEKYFKEGMSEEEKNNLQNLLKTGAKDHKDFLENKDEKSKRFNQYMEKLKKYLDPIKIENEIKKEIENNKKNVEKGE